MFNITNFLVSQVNPHIVPWIPKTTPGARRQTDGLLRRLANHASQDILRRCMVLADLGVIPRFFGQVIPGKVFSQKYLGNINIVPSLTLRDSFKSIMNPSVKDMERYLDEGRRSTWPKLSHIRFLMRIENQLAACKARVLTSAPGHPAIRSSSYDSIPWLASSGGVDSKAGHTNTILTPY